MRRPPIVCRRAVQSLQPPPPQHIWISEELVSSTLHRFFRSSCPQQKRHGSHVPGPLEARRRAAKRQMTVSANFYPQDSFSSWFNLGALFGVRSNPQPSWRYEPPSLQPDVEPSGSAWDATSPALSPQSLETNSNSWKPSESLPNTAYSFSQNIPHIHGEQYTTAQPRPHITEAARPAFLSAETQETEAIEQARACADAFKSFIAETTGLTRQEKNTVIRHAFRDCCSASASSSMYTAMVIHHMVELGCDPIPVLQQHSTTSFAVPVMQSPEYYGFLVDLEKLMESFPRCARDIHHIHRRLAKSVLSTYASTSYSQSHDKELMFLVRQLWQSAHVQGAMSEESATVLLRSVTKLIRHRFCRLRLSAILSNIATAEHRIPALIGNVEKDGSRLSYAVDVLSCLPKERLLRCIPKTTCDIAKAVVNDQIRKPTSQTPHRMHVWLQLLRHLDSGHSLLRTSLLDEAMAALTKYVFARNEQGNGSILVLLKAVVTMATQTDSFQQVPGAKICNLISSLESAAGQSGPVPVGTAFDILLTQAKHEDLPQEPLVQSLLDIVARHAGLKFTVPFLQVLEQRKFALTDSAPLHRAVAMETAAIRSRRKATEVARQHKAFALHVCQTVTRLLNSLSSVTPTMTLKPQLDTLQAKQQLAHILNRAQIDQALPLVYRHAIANLTINDSVHLIHQLAHQYSTDSTRTQREAWRAVYYLYRYLRGNSLHIGPLFSKAVVRISLIRPMSENRFVSARRLIWVRHLVTQVEGEVVAKQIEASFWTWRGELIKHAKTVYVGVGGQRQDKAHLGTMKKLGLI